MVHGFAVPSRGALCDGEVGFHRGRLFEESQPRGVRPGELRERSRDKEVQGRNVSEWRRCDG